MTARLKIGVLALLLTSGAFVVACQSPTKSTETYDVDDFLDAAASPDPAPAAVCTDGKTYRVVRGNNQPDDILAYDWITRFSVTLTFNSNATSKDVDLTFPVTITAATAKAEQATGGIVSPPTGGDVEHYESAIVSTTSNKFTGVGSAQTITFDVWYDMPNLMREALVTVTVNLKDTDGVTFSKTATVQAR